MRLTGLLLALLCAACVAERPADTAASARAPWDSGWVDVERGRLYYEVAGAGPAMVLIHGVGDRRVWDHQMGSLPADFRVVRYDHRGFGRSPAPDTAYSPVQDLRRLLDALGIRRATLVGSSMGGTLALDFALLHPDRVERLVLVGGSASGLPVHANETSWMGAVFQTARAGRLERAATLLGAHPMFTVSNREPETRDRLRTLLQENRAALGMAYWPSEPMSPWAHERLADVHPPTLVVVGEHDAPVALRLATLTMRGIPGARPAIVEGADHLPQLTHPEAFERVLRDFVAATPAAADSTPAERPAR